MTPEGPNDFARGRRPTERDTTDNEVVVVTESPATPDATPLRGVTVTFAPAAEFSRYDGDVRLHTNGWVEVPELRRLFPPDAVAEISY